MVSKVSKTSNETKMPKANAHKCLSARTTLIDGISANDDNAQYMQWNEPDDVATLSICEQVCRDYLNVTLFSKWNRPCIWNPYWQVCQ